MHELIAHPAVIEAAGNKPKRIEEYAGRVNSGHQGVSIARMQSPEGWQEPGQRPDFEEITVVLRGTLRVEFEGGSLDVNAGHLVILANTGQLLMDLSSLKVAPVQEMLRSPAGVVGLHPMFGGRVSSWADLAILNAPPGPHSGCTYS